METKILCAIGYIIGFVVAGFPLILLFGGVGLLIYNGVKALIEEWSCTSVISS